MGLGSAIDYHQQMGEQRKYQRILELKYYFTSQLSASDKFLIKTPESDALSAGITTVEVKGKDIKAVKAILAVTFAIDCRAMCTHNLNGLRFSLSVFNTQSDIDYLIDAFQQV